jgi:hypothetical protein
MGCNKPVRNSFVNYYPFWVFLGVLALVSCASERPTPSAPDLATVNQQLLDARKLLADNNWPKAQIAFRSIIEAKRFGGLPSDTQYLALWIGAKVSIYYGDPNVGYGYLLRAIDMPQAGFDQWWMRVKTDISLDKDADAVSSLTTLAQRWPEQSRNLDADFVLEVVTEAKQLPHRPRYALLRALYDAHWTLKGNIEPSEAWRDLTLLLLENGHLAEATEVSAHVVDPYALVAMRSDRRFDAIVTATPEHFDIDAASIRMLGILESAVEESPRLLSLRWRLLQELMHQQHYAAMLEAADAIVMEVQSTDAPDTLFEDYNDQYRWLLDYRAFALERAGRWDDAVAQLTVASGLPEMSGANVTQLIDLGALDSRLGNPNEALSAIARVDRTAANAYGVMRVESVRLNAAVEMGDAKQAARSLEYLRKHRSDAPYVYEDALIAMNQLDLAAHELMAQFLDPDQRQEALETVQQYAPHLMLPRQAELRARQREVIGRKDVQAVIQKVGRVASYVLEDIK